MKRFSFQMAFALGALAVIWVAATVATSNLMVLTMAAVIAAVYVVGALELQQYRKTTSDLSHALTQIPDPLPELNDWLITLPAGLQNPVRLRIEGDRMGMPGPALTPYLVGLLVMLGMLGTFLGMVITLNGAVFALEGSSNIAGIRAAFSEPIKGLGLAFGTSVAGVATSAMLGLMASLCRRERAQTAQQLDLAIATRLRHFSLTHQRQETFKALQEQSQALPHLVQQLQNLMGQLTQTSNHLQARLQANQQDFHQEVRAAYTGLAQSVDQSLRSSLSQSMHLASEGIRPVVQATLAHMAEQAHQINDQLLHNTRQQLGELSLQFKDTATQLTHTSSQTLSQHHEASAVMVSHVGQTLDQFSQTFAQRAQDLVLALQNAQTEQQTRQGQLEQQRQSSWQASLDSMATALGGQWEALGSQTLARQVQICDTLTHTAQTVTEQVQDQARQTLADMARLVADNEALMQARIASEAQWTARNEAQVQALGSLLRTEWMALRDAEDARGQAAVARLAELQTALTAHLSTLGMALEAPIARLIETASQAPKAAAEVIGQLRQEISVSVARDNTLLEERTRIMQTLSTLLDAINHASTEQRHVIDTLVTSSALKLDEANAQFTQHVGSESAKLGSIAAQVTASAVDVASLGETFGFAVRTFSESNEKLMQQLQRIEQAIDKSMARSDEQLAYYVAQAREIIDLSISSQKDVLDALQQRQTEGAT